MDQKEAIDDKIKREQSYQYLCRVEEVRVWLQTVLSVKLPVSTIEFEERLRNGVLLAKLAHFIYPELVLTSKIYDIDEELYESHGLRFKHTENINHFMDVFERLAIPNSFSLETTDIYNKNNMPKVIHCLHSLISHLHKLKQTQEIVSLAGKITFTDEEMDIVNRQLKEQGCQLNFDFGSLGDTGNHVTSAFQCGDDKENRDVKNQAAVYLKKLNVALESGSDSDFSNALRHSSLGIDKEKLKYEYIPLYFMELKEDRQAQKRPITLESLHSTIDVLYKIGKVSDAVDSKCAEKLWSALNSSLIMFQDMDYDLKEMYLKALDACKRYTEMENCECPLLSYMNIQDCIDIVNDKARKGKKDNGEPFKKLTNIIVNGSCESFYNELMNSPLEIDANVIAEEDLWLLQHFLKHQLSLGNEVKFNQELLNDGIVYVNHILDTLSTDTKWLKTLNESLMVKDLSTVVELIQHVPLPGVNVKNVQLIALLLMTEKEKCTGHSSWVEHRIQSFNVAVDLKTEKFHWILDDDTYSDLLLKDPFNISLSNLENVINIVNRNDLIQKICKFQSHCKGYLMRKMLANRSIQKSRRTITKKSPVVKIQAAWRGYRVRKIFTSVLSQKDVSFKTLKSFLSLIDINTGDYNREIELQTLRSSIVKSIRRNTELVGQIKKMDITIGLLVQNRISLMDAVEESKKIGIGISGFKSLHAESQHILEGYQHLFYTLQTSPHYLAKLVFCLPQRKSSKFLQSVIFSLYNFGANKRDEYLLLKLFRHALREEIRCKFDNPLDIITNNPLILKLVVNYARLSSGQNALKHILGGLLLKVLNNKELSIETNPICIYNHWRNETEMKSGQSSKLPTSVTCEAALRYDEVVKRLNVALEMLKTNVKMFLDRIVKTKDSLPYGLRYIAKELKEALMEKFPDTPSKEIMKVVGNMLYYQFINPAIVAPDVFEIIALPPNESLTGAERHNLASIAKILQFSAAKKGFGEESKHLMVLNHFIIECHDIFKEHFNECCQVEDLDAHFARNEFTEATLITSPTIYISLQEIIEIHSLLKTHESELISEPNDPLKELLNDIGAVPTLAQLAGYDENLKEYDERRIAITEVGILLTNKFEASTEDNSDLSKLFVQAKELLVKILPYLSGHTLIGALRMDCSNESSQLFLEKNPGQGTLKDCKNKLRKYLNQLNEQGIISKDDGYQSILQAVATDISHKNKYRLQQSKDFKNVEETLKSLREKTEYYEVQIKYYQKYIDSCLENLHTGKKNIHLVKRNCPNEKIVVRHSLKYSGAKLHEKGVLISIEGLPSSQLKNVYFEICPSDVIGIFIVSGKFMGVEVEKIELDMQDLLRLQYNGIGVKNIFGKAKININLLIFLLNDKFYKKIS